MDNQLFNLTILPLFEQDLNEIVDYLNDSLHNPTAANKLVNDVQSAIMERLKQPLGYAPFRSLKKRSNDYYTIRVRNFTIFYVVIGNTMEVRRILYSKRDLDNLI